MKYQILIVMCYKTSFSMPGFEKNSNPFKTSSTSLWITMTYKLKKINIEFSNIEKWKRNGEDYDFDSRTWCRENFEIDVERKKNSYGQSVFAFHCSPTPSTFPSPKLSPCNFSPLPPPSFILLPLQLLSFRLLLLKLDNIPLKKLVKLVQSKFSSCFSYFMFFRQPV